MEIVCCRSTDSTAEKAFRLRYQVYGAEMGVYDLAIDHGNGIYVDQYDEFARIYIAIKGDQAIATCRSLYDRDYDFHEKLPKSVGSLLGIDNFLKAHSGSLAISTKFAISPSHRGSLAAHLVTARMFDDLIEDGINFVFSWCAPELFDFYSQLGFHMYSRAVSDENGLWTPIVLVTRDWEHLRNIKSPLYRQLERKDLCGPTHPSVSWFYENYGASLESFLTSYDDSILDKLLSGSEAIYSGSNPQDIGIFNSMTSEDVKKIIGSGRVLQFTAGEDITLTGQIQDEMFIIVSGEILEKRLDGALPSSIIGRGQVVGEIAMLTGTVRSSDCVATCDTQLVSLSRKNLAKIMKATPDLAARLLYNISRLQSHKLLKANQDMVELYLDLR